jgi:hypothetical protein
MRVLIISSYRCGGSCLSKWLSLELNIEHIGEPYHELKTPDESILYKDNILVKFPYRDFCRLKTHNIQDFISLFDKTFALTRDDLMASSESAIMTLHSKIAQYYTYFIDDIFLKKNNTEIEKTYNTYKYYYDKIKELDILQITYENIFINRTDINILKEYFNIDKFNYLSMLDYSRRYRKFDKNYLKKSSKII